MLANKKCTIFKYEAFTSWRDCFKFCPKGLRPARLSLPKGKYVRNLREDPQWSRPSETDEFSNLPSRLGCGVLLPIQRLSPHMGDIRYAF